MQFLIVVADNRHINYAASICKMMKEAAKVRGTGIAERQPEYIQQKITEGKAVIALDGNLVIGFCYIESWENHKYVANSGLITHPDYRKMGLAKAIKKEIFKLSKKQFPTAKLFGITTSMAVMKINSDLGYHPVPFSEITKDDNFWKGCKSCKNYDILQRTDKTMCLCTGMVCDFKASLNQNKVPNKKSWESFMDFLNLRKMRVHNKAKQFPQLLKRQK